MGKRIADFFRSDLDALVLVAAARMVLHIATNGQAIADSFGSWTKGPARLENGPSATAHRVLDVTDRPDAPQSIYMKLGLRVPPPSSPDSIPLVVTNTLLGGSYNSRVTSNTREQKGYTYSPTVKSRGDITMHTGRKMRM